MEILVSVIMPVYNAEKYLPMALDSVINQTLKSIEIICVDDGSTDRSYEILQEYAGKDSRFIVMKQENQYAGVARNSGMRIARGKYLSFLDADDYFKSTMLEEAYQCAEAENADVVVYGGELFNNMIDETYNADYFLNTELIPQGNSFAKKDNLEFLFNFTNSAAWNKLFRKVFIEEKQLYFQPMKRANDLYFVEMALAMAERIGVVRKNLIAYRTDNESSLQGWNDETPLNFLDALKAVQRQLIDSDLYHELKKSFQNMCLGHCSHNLGSMNTKEAFEDLYQLIKDEMFFLFDIHLMKRAEYLNINIYNEYQFILSHTAEEYWHWKTGKKEYIFPFQKIPKGSKIILYGAGKVGQAYHKQIVEADYCSVTAWVDKSASKIGRTCIITPQNASWKDCEYIVIAIENKNIVDDIVRGIVEIDPDLEKRIIWEQ